MGVRSASTTGMCRKNAKQNIKSFVISDVICSSDRKSPLSSPLVKVEIWLAIMCDRNSTIDVLHVVGAQSHMVLTIQGHCTRKTACASIQMHMRCKSSNRFRSDDQSSNGLAHVGLHKRTDIDIVQLTHLRAFCVVQIALLI